MVMHQFHSHWLPSPVPKVLFYHRHIFIRYPIISHNLSEVAVIMLFQILKRSLSLRKAGFKRSHTLIIIPVLLQVNNKTNYSLAKNSWLNRRAWHIIFMFPKPILLVIRIASRLVYYIVIKCLTLADLSYPAPAVWTDNALLTS